MTKDIEWLGQLVAAMDAVMDRDLFERHLRAVWRVLRWSFGQGRQATGRLTERELAARAGMTAPQANKALNELERMLIIQRKPMGGGCEFLPELKGLHHWRVPYRLKEEGLFVAARMDTAQQVPEGQMDFWPEDTLAGQGSANMSRTAAQKDANHQAGKSVQNNTGDLASPAASATCGVASQPGVPSKSFSPTVQSNALKDTLNTLRGSPAISKIASPSSITTGEPAAGMYGEDYLDPYATDEKTLMQRLERALGKEGPSGMKKKGGLWRSFIRGSLEVADDPSTAEAVRDALNLLEDRQRKGETIREVGGFLFEYARDYAAGRGWAYRHNPDGNGGWKKVPAFSYFKYRNAKGKRTS